MRASVHTRLRASRLLPRAICTGLAGLREKAVMAAPCVSVMKRGHSALRAGQSHRNINKGLGDCVIFDARIRVNPMATLIISYGATESRLSGTDVA